MSSSLPAVEPKDWRLVQRLRLELTKLAKMCPMEEEIEADASFGTYEVAQGNKVEPRLLIWGRAFSETLVLSNPSPGLKY